MKRHYLKTKDGTIIRTDEPKFWTECEPLKASEGHKLFVEQERQTLRKWLKPGDTVYTLVRHVSNSGMSRRISLFIIHDGDILDIGGWAATVLDWRRNDKDGALLVGGCGMDMGFHSVYCLSRALFPDGFATTHGRNGDTSGWDNDGGYALKQRWL